MLTQYTGEIFAGLTACCWVISATCFEFAGKRIGSLVVNLLRLGLAVVLLSLICAVRTGTPWPTDATHHVYLWIVISGVIGFFLCDMCLFRAFVLAGARRSMLMLSLAPCFAAILDIVTGQSPTIRMATGMVITLIGVTWVIRARAMDRESPHSRRELQTGIVLAIAAALLQAVGAKCAESGLDIGAGQRYDAMSATLIRCTAGTVCFAILLITTGRFSRVVAGAKDRRAMGALSIGAVCGPVIGVSLFLASLARVQPSVTQTILATMPVLMLPIAHYLHRERITRGAIAGTVLSMVGVVVLCWKPV